MSTASRGSRNIGEGKLEYSFDGRPAGALPGDTAAAALLRQGVRLLGRSVKYRRPRGLVTMGAEEPNALLTLDHAGWRVPNIPASTLEIERGMALSSQNRWPSLRFDLHAALQAGAGVFSAGFYYKTFIWPSWRAWEGLIRHLAGLGPAPQAPRLPAPQIEHARCDVLVAGGGAAGLSAALAAARGGARVVLCERDRRCGGELEFETARIDGLPAPAWVERTLAELRARGARVLTGTAVVGSHDGLVVGQCVVPRPDAAQRWYQFRAQHLLLAMGADERPLAFANNDRPGVMLLGAAERLLAGYGVAAARSPVLFGCHDRLYAAARRLLAGGVRVQALVDARRESESPGSREAREALRRAGVSVHACSAVRRVEGRFGVSGVQVVSLGDPNRALPIACDGVLMSGGWLPVSAPTLQEGGRWRWSAESQAYLGALRERDWRRTLGAAAGRFELPAILADAYQAGGEAARAIRDTAAAQQPSGPAVADEAAAPPCESADGAPAGTAFFRAPATAAEEKLQFVDFQNDVTVADLRLAIAEGFSHVEHAKRYTTLGIGTDQGRIGGTLGAAVLAELQGRGPGGVQPSRLRQPYLPVPLGVLAGYRTRAAYRALRRTPLDAAHQAAGGALEAFGSWMRPRFYRDNGADAATAAVAEARRVRASGGILDGSTLGKIEFAGPDAARLLDRLYLTPASSLRIGRARYMVSLREDGMVLDDGLVLRLEPDRFLAMVSSGHGLHMLSHFELHQVELGLRAVAITDVTECWAVIVVAGPRSRSVLLELLGGAWQARVAGLPHMACAVGEHGGAPLRVLRASFSGELAYELHCAAQIAPALWDALRAAGLEPYGLDAVDILRIEKGYLTGAEFNGQTTPDDLGLAHLVRSAKECIGRDLLTQPAYQLPARPRLVGVRARRRDARLLPGAQLTESGSRRPCGHVTSAAFSPTLDQAIGLALLERRLAEPGRRFVARDPLRGIDTEVEVGSPVHFDPEGTRMRG